MKIFDNVVFGLHRLFMCIPDVAGKNHKTGGKCKMKFGWPLLCAGIGHQPKDPRGRKTKLSLMP